MKLCKIQELTGGEILAKDILTSELKVLLSAGIVLRPEYIAKINSLGITEVYIEEKLEEKNEVLLLKTSLENEFHDKVKHIMERHLYSKNKELMKLSETADHIIMSVHDEKQDQLKKFMILRRECSDIYEHSGDSMFTCNTYSTSDEKLTKVQFMILLPDVFFMISD